VHACGDERDGHATERVPDDDGVVRTVEGVDHRPCIFGRASVDVLACQLWRNHAVAARFELGDERDGHATERVPDDDGVVRTHATRLPLTRPGTALHAERMAVDVVVAPLDGPASITLQGDADVDLDSVRATHRRHCTSPAAGDPDLHRAVSMHVPAIALIPEPSGDSRLQQPRLDHAGIWTSDESFAAKGSARGADGLALAPARDRAAHERQRRERLSCRWAASCVAGRPARRPSSRVPVAAKA
jgi:hypothetical protein